MVVKLSGYYRVNYDYNNWQALTDQLISDHKVITPVIRAKLIDDALNLAIDKKLNYNTALSLLDYFPQEKHYLPQISVLYNLKNLFIKFEQTSIETWLKVMILIFIYLHIPQARWTISMMFKRWSFSFRLSSAN